MNVSSWSDSPFVDSNPELENTPTHARWDDYTPRSSPEEIRFTIISGIYFLKLLGKEDQNRCNLSNLTGQLNAILEALDYLSSAYPESRLEPLEELCAEFNVQVEGLNVEINEKIWNMPSKILNLQQIIRSDTVKRAIDSFEKRLHDVRQNITMANVLKTSSYISSARSSTTKTTSILSAIHQDLNGILDRIDPPPSYFSQLTAHLPGLILGDLVVRDDERSLYMNEFGDPVGFTATARVEPSARVKTLRIFVSGDKRRDSQRWTNEIVSGNLLPSQFSAPISSFCYNPRFTAILYDAEYIPLSEYLPILSPLQYLLFVSRTVWDVNKISDYLIEEGIPPGRHEGHRHLNIFIGSLVNIHANSGNMKIIGNLSSWMSHSDYVRQFWPKSLTYTLSGPFLFHYHLDNPPLTLPLTMKGDTFDSQAMFEYVCKALRDFPRRRQIRSPVPLDGIYLNPLVHPICVPCNSTSHFETEYVDQLGDHCLDRIEMGFTNDNEGYRRHYGETLAKDDVSPGYYFTEGQGIPKPKSISQTRNYIRTLFEHFDHSVISDGRHDDDTPIICLPKAVRFSWWLRPVRWPLLSPVDENVVVYATSRRLMYKSDGSLKVPNCSWITDPPEKKAEMIDSGHWVIETELYWVVDCYSWPQKYWDAMRELHEITDYQSRVLESSEMQESQHFIRNLRPCLRHRVEQTLLPSTTRTSRPLSHEADDGDLIEDYTSAMRGRSDSARVVMRNGRVWKIFSPSITPSEAKTSDVTNQRNSLGVEHPRRICFKTILLSLLTIALAKGFTVFYADFN